MPPLLVKAQVVWLPASIAVTPLANQFGTATITAAITQHYGVTFNGLPKAASDINEALKLVDSLVKARLDAPMSVYSDAAVALVNRNRDKIRAIYDERFCRMWEYYLTVSEAAFRQLDNVVFQVQLAKRRDAVPLVRDYITEFERAAARPEHRHSA